MQQSRIGGSSILSFLCCSTSSSLRSRRFLWDLPTAMAAVRGTASLLCLATSGSICLGDCFVWDSLLLQHLLRSQLLSSLPSRRPLKRRTKANAKTLKMLLSCCCCCCRCSHRSWAFDLLMRLGGGAALEKPKTKTTWTWTETSAEHTKRCLLWQTREKGNNDEECLPNGCDKTDRERAESQRKRKKETER